MNNPKIEDNFEAYLEECPEVKTTIHWYDLYENHSIELEKEFLAKFMKNVVNKAGSISALGRKTEIPRKILSNIINKKRNPRITTLKKIVEYTTSPSDIINKKIIKINGLKPKLPFQLNNKEGAEIRAAFLSDGHVDKNPTAGPQYCALEKESHNRLVESCKKVFGEFNTNTKWGHKTYVTRFPAAISTPLRKSGVPFGDKRLKNCYVPKDILQNEEFIKVYLRKVFDDEGDIGCTNKKRSVRLSRSIDISEAINNLDLKSEIWTPCKLPSNLRHNLLFGEKIMLEKLGIRTSIYSEGIYKSKIGRITAKWRLVILQQDNLKKFAELINFNLVDKQNKLKGILKSYIIHKRSNGEGDKYAAEFLMKIYKEKGFFTFGDLGRELVRTGRGYDSAGRYLGNLIKKEIIRKIKPNYYVFTSDKY